MSPAILKRALCLLALAGVFTFTFASAKEPADDAQPAAATSRTGAPTSAKEATI
ncbi:MAG: hypothetical protein HY290_23980, partial [Planctomycetia bacterium]|nr:hypothetical protein [Planctomycetia bacterium]